MRVHYEVTGVRDSRPTREALGDLILLGIVEYVQGFLNYDWSLILKFEPMYFTEVKCALKAYSVKYRSPTYFCNSSLKPRFATPEDEIADNPTERYLRHAAEECQK